MKCAVHSFPQPHCVSLFSVVTPKTASFPLTLPGTKLPPKLVVFNLDHTLIAGDSTILWTEWLYEKEIVKDPIWRQIDREMMRDYSQGHLDMPAFMRKHSGAFRKLPVAEIEKLVLEFVKKRIAPIAFPDGRKWVRNCTRAGIPMVVLSATTTFIVAPVAKLVFGINEAIGVDLVEENGFFTGEIAGVPSFQEGKITRLLAVTERMGIGIKDVLFFTDSRNDLPLAEAAGYTCCVNPDPVLLTAARRKGWKVLDWKLALRTQLALDAKKPVA